MAVRTAERLLEEPEPAVRFPERTPYERTLLDHHVLGFSLNAHVTDHYQRRLEKIGVVPSASLESGAPDRPVRVGGLVVCRQRPATAKGYMFLTLEDRFGLVNVVVRPDVYARYRDALRNHPLIAVAGRLQRALGATNVLAERALAVDPTIPDDALDDTGAIPSPDTPALAVPAHNFR